MDLLDVLVDEYFPRRLTIRSADTKRQYLYAFQGFSRFLIRRAKLEDLTDDNLIRFARRLLDDGLTEATVNERIGRITAVWNWLAKRGVVKVFPTWQAMPEAERVPRAWRREELTALFLACRRFPGEYCGVPAGAWWTAFHCFLWDSGERKSAVLSVRWDWVDLAGGHVSIPATARKGKRKPMVYALKPHTLTALAAIASPRRPLVFPFEQCEASWYGQYTKLLKLAGLPHDRTCKAQRMRVSFASWVKAMGGDPTEALAHSTPHVTIRHYLDPTITQQSPNRLLWTPDSQDSS